jgi:biotin-dependent carboxylase-like uncharacterized protein
MIKFIKPGIEVLVEDWPGRLGYMGMGMAASGAMDNLALQMGNKLVGNDPTLAGLEIAAGYCEFEFTEPGLIAVTGADMSPTLNGAPLPLWTAVAVNAGDKLAFSHFGAQGFRAYLSVRGGIGVEPYLGSRSTCLFGEYGGFQGRKLAAGDELPVDPAPPAPELAGKKINPAYLPDYTNDWELRVVVGPNAVPDYVTEEGMDKFFAQDFKVSHNANRAAYRLAEVPEGFWARPDGGAGGSHPSNIVDHGYNMRGAINVTGNTPSLLIADGPTLGGYVCIANVINADLWKIGQAIPSRDKVHFTSVSIDDAIQARRDRAATLAAPDLVI